MSNIRLNDLLADTQRRAEQAEIEIIRLQACLDTERRIPLGRYAFYHRHRALAYVRRVNPSLHQEASNAAYAEIDRDGGKSFEDVVAELARERDAALAVAADSAQKCAELRRLALIICDSEIAYSTHTTTVSRAALLALRAMVE